MASDGIANKDNCIPRNEWDRLTIPALGAWDPALHVSVLIPVHDGQAKLDRTLAALTRQTYPEELLEVIVADDGSEPPISLPDIRPADTKLVRSRRGEGRWGPAAAVNRAAAAASGEVLHRVDADMILYPEHVEAHARWHHATDLAVVLGNKTFIDISDVSPDEIVLLASTGRLDALSEGRLTQERYWQVDLIEERNQLLDWTWDAWRVTVGGTMSCTTAMFRAAGTMAEELMLGEDTEFGYRLDAAGALFVPEPEARSWHQGMTRIMREGAAAHGYRLADFETYIPHPWGGRRTAPVHWATPRFHVALYALDASFDQLADSVGRLLKAGAGGVHVSVVFGRAADDSHLLSMDGMLGRGRTRGMLEAWTTADPRVRCVTEAPETGFPAMFTVEAPWYAGFAEYALDRLHGLAESRDVGAVSVSLPGGSGVVRFSLTKAVARSRWCAMLGGDSHAAGELFGHLSIPGATVGLRDLRQAGEEVPPAGGPSEGRLFRAYKALPPGIRRHTSRAGRAVRRRRP